MMKICKLAAPLTVAQTLRREKRRGSGCNASEIKALRHSGWTLPVSHQIERRDGVSTSDRKVTDRFPCVYVKNGDPAIHATWGKKKGR